MGHRSMPDAWVGSDSIGRAKTFTAMAFSSNENALTNRLIGELSWPGAALWQTGNSNKIPGLTEFPGGLPLCKEGDLSAGSASAATEWIRTGTSPKRERSDTNPIHPSGSVRSAASPQEKDGRP